MDTARKEILVNTLPFHDPHPWHNRFIKRNLDVFISAIGLILLSPVFALLAFLVNRDSPGPIFFRGPRAGKDGKIFNILKFRTMYERPESYMGASVTAEGDERITPSGKWLRDTKLNELPQLWNVLVGEMSLVGPRPEDPEIAAGWPEDARSEILSVRPGITSPASITYHNEEKLLSQDNLMGDYLEKILPDKLRMDRLYVRHYTLMADLDAIFWTFIVILPRVNRPQREGMIFGGPFTRLARPYLNWILIDFLTAFMSAVIVGFAWRMVEPLNIGWNWAPVVAITLALEFSLINTALGLGRVEWSRAVAEDVFGLFLSCAIVVSVNILADMYFSFLNVPNGYFLAASLVTLMGFIVNRYRFRLVTGFATRWINFRKKGYGVGERVLVVGAGAGGEMVTWLLHRPDFQRMFEIVGYIDDDPTKQGMRYDGHPVIGTTADLPEVVKENDVGVIFYTINKVSTSDRERILATCRKSGVRLVLLSDVLRTIQSQIISGKVE